MNITDIYNKYSIPINLRQHMFRVAGVGKIICDNIKPSILIDSNIIVRTLLLHDMGNILKMDFNNTQFLVDKDKKRIDMLRKVQKSFQIKYGNDADDATIKILKEIGVDQKIIDLCAGFHGKYASEFLQEDRWEKKIAYYCDMRVGPIGVISLDGRYDDLKERYSYDNINIDIYRKQCICIEKQLQEVVSIKLNTIDNKLVERESKKLKTTKIL